MKIALLSGADKNAGDFLIVHRSKQLLLKLIDGCKLVEFPRNKPLDSRLAELNTCDTVVFAGGPGYVPDMYPTRFPLVDDISKIEPPFFALGMGGYTPTSNIEGIRFSERSRYLLDRIESDGFGLGCRDILTQRLLQANGYTSVRFTGCPAWFDLSKVEAASLLKTPRRDEIRSIAISDPAILRSINSPKFLVEELAKAFPNAKIKLVFHRGWTNDEFTDTDLAMAQTQLVRWAKSIGVDPVDISYSHEGFTVYDTCDLHIGYRVHAHLYNISQRKPTFLIEEDGRGYGANDALGSETHVALPRSRTFSRAIAKLLRKAGVNREFGRKKAQKAAKRMVVHVLDEIEQGYPEANKACRIANKTFYCMESHISQLNRLIPLESNERKRCDEHRVSSKTCYAEN